jgi:general secretion pathway protein C
MLAPLLLAALAAPPPDLVASGLVWSALPERSVAILRSGGRTRLATVGETAFGGRVVAIGPGVVTLEFDSRQIELRLASSAGATLSTPAPAAEAALDPEAPARTLPRRDVERRLTEEIPRILAETALSPVMEEGQVKGFTLTRVAEGTLLTEAGLRPGDVLMEINDTPVDSLATLMGLWPRLRNESELRAVVLRNGRPVSLSVSLR